MGIPQTRHYVILKHTLAGDAHWDLMLETAEHLATWRISTPPKELCRTSTDAEKIFDHSKKFLTYQGPVNKGKGNVTTEDKGTYSIISENEDKLQIQITAKILNGKFTLQHKSQNAWEFSAL